MNYRKNPDNTFTAFKLMKYDNTMLEATAEQLENAQQMLRKEIEAYKNYSLEEVRTFFSPGQPDNKGIVYSREKEINETSS